MAKNFNDFFQNKNSFDSYKIKIKQNKNLISRPLPKIPLYQKKGEAGKKFLSFKYLEIKILNLGGDDSNRQKQTNLELGEESNMISTSSKTLSATNKSTLKSSNDTSKIYFQNEEKKSQNSQKSYLHKAKSNQNFNNSLSDINESNLNLGLNNTMFNGNEISRKNEEKINFAPKQESREVHANHPNNNFYAQVIDNRKFSILDIQAVEHAVALNSNTTDEVSKNICKLIILFFYLNLALNSSQLSNFSSNCNLTKNDIIKTVDKGRKLTKTSKLFFILAKSE